MGDNLSEADKEELEFYMRYLDDGYVAYGPFNNPRSGTGEKNQLSFRGPGQQGKFIEPCKNTAIIDILVKEAKGRDQWKPVKEKANENEKSEGSAENLAEPKVQKVQGSSAGTATLATVPKDDNMKTATLPTKVVDDFPLLRKVVSNAAWFADAMNEIGFNAMLMGLQVGHFDPKEAAVTIMEFRDEEGGKEKFIEFVNRRLQALYEAHENGGRIFELEREVKAEKGKRLVAELQRADAERNARDMYDLYKMAKNSMCEEDLQTLLENTAFAKMLASVNPEVIKAETISMISKKGGDESD